MGLLCSVLILFRHVMHAAIIGRDTTALGAPFLCSVIKRHQSCVMNDSLAKMMNRQKMHAGNAGQEAESPCPITLATSSCCGRVAWSEADWQLAGLEQEL